MRGTVYGEVPAELSSKPSSEILVVKAIKKTVHFPDPDFYF